MQPSVLLARSLIALGLLIGIAMQAPARAEKRIALVIGNNAYENVPKLEKAVNDAKAVAASLRSIGFEVLLATDVSRRDFARQLAEFNGRVQTNDLALFFYAGHGIEVRGANYVLPLDVPAARDGQETLITDEAEALALLESKLRESIRLQSVADVPLGAFLSGGVDSSLIASLMQSEFTSQVRTFTIGFGEKEYDEAGYARAVARHLGTKHV